MKTTNLSRMGLFIVGLWALLCGFGARGDVYVEVTVDGFWPARVSIVTGEYVIWLGADEFGPYSITSDTMAWVPGWVDLGDSFAVRFDKPGDYGYSDVTSANSGVVHVVSNTPPSVTITNPLNNAVFTAPASFTFGADAADTDVDGLSDVEFYVGTTLVDDVFFSPYTTSVTNLDPGTYVLSVIAYDNAGATASNAVSITVLGASINLSAPGLAAGQFRFDVSGLTAGKTNVLQASSDLASSANWVSLQTNVATGTSASFTNAASLAPMFYRLLQLP